MAMNNKPPPRRGFTLIELLVVIGIIVVLISILLPVVSSVRIRAQVTQTQAQMSKLQQAIMNYYHDWNAYPGPLANDQLVHNTPPPGGQVTTVGLTGLPVTSSENLALGLLGYIDPNYVSGQIPPPTQFTIDNTLVPPGPPRPPKHEVLSLSTPKSYHYIDFVATEVTVGYWLGAPGQTRITDSTGSAQPISDTIVPEFVDSIYTGIGPMPILYARANAGASAIWYNGGAQPQGGAQYDVSQFSPYGFTTPDSTDFPSAGLSPSSPWTKYLMNSNIAGTARGKDGFILISAGADRKYGTADDIILTP